MHRWLRAIIVAPVWGALSAVGFSIAVMFIDNRYRESYWPIITEFWVFGLSYLGLGFVNLLIGTPIAALLARITARLHMGVAIGLCQGVIAAYLGMFAGLFPPQYSLLAYELWLAVIIPLLITGLSSFIYFRQP